MDPSTSQDDFFLADEEEAPKKFPQESSCTSPAAFWSLISILCVPSPFDSKITPTVPQSPAFDDPPQAQTDPEPVLDLKEINERITVLRESEKNFVLSGAADLLDATLGVVMKDQRVEMQTEICNLVCDTCQNMMENMMEHDDPDRLIEALCAVLEEPNDDAAHALSAMIAVFGVTTRQVDDFIMPIVLRGLSDASDESTCKISMNLLGDLAQRNSVTFEVFGSHLVGLCMSHDADPSVKLCALSLLSSSLVAKDQSCYLSSVLPSLVQVIAESEHEAADYQTEYFTAVFEVCSGIVDAFRVKGSDTSVLESHVVTIATILNRLDSSNKAASQLSRDLAEILRPTKTLTTLES